MKYSLQIRKVEDGAFAAVCFCGEQGPLSYLYALTAMRYAIDSGWNPREGLCPRCEEDRLLVLTDEARKITERMVRSLTGD